MWRSEQQTRIDRMALSDVPMSISPFLSLRYPCIEALDWIKQRLAESNLRAVQTFDLHEARAGSTCCTCPYHGTQECDCQMVVLLVYGRSSQPATLILHGNDGQTWISFGDTLSTQSDTGLMQTIQHVLDAPNGKLRVEQA
jgi:hypothetical protein